MEKVLLTGGTGFIGSHLIKALISLGYQVVVLKRSTTSEWRLREDNISYDSFNVDQFDLCEVFKKYSFSAVIHLATNYVKNDDSASIKEMYDSNVTFPGQLAELASRNGVKCFINTGTFFEYDCSVLPVNENSEIRPFNLYAKTKTAFESVVRAYSDKMNVVTFRLFSPYGEKDNEKLIPLVIKKALKDEEIKLSDGMQKLDFIYVKDIVNAYICVLEKILQNKAKSSYEIYNLGSGFPLSIREVVSVIEQALNKRLNVTWGAMSKNDIPVAFSDNKKLCGSFAWKPEYSIHEGIRNTIEYYRIL